jgi:hypothetical protein
VVQVCCEIIPGGIVGADAPDGHNYARVAVHRAKLGAYPGGLEPFQM